MEQLPPAIAEIMSLKPKPNVSLCNGAEHK